MRSLKRIELMLIMVLILVAGAGFSRFSNLKQIQAQERYVSELNRRGAEGIRQTEAAIAKALPQYEEGKRVRVKSLEQAIKESNTKDFSKMDFIKKLEELEDELKRDAHLYHRDFEDDFKRIGLAIDKKEKTRLELLKKEEEALLAKKAEEERKAEVQAQVNQQAATTQKPAAAKPVSKPAPVVRRNQVCTNSACVYYGAAPDSKVVPYSNWATQVAIDNNQAAFTGGPFNPHDGLIDYLAGHNPGGFSPIATSLHIGQIITVYDSNGKAFNYKVSGYDNTKTSQADNGFSRDVHKTPMPAGVNVLQALTKNGGLAGNGLAIQHCDTYQGPVITHFWYATRI